MVNGFYTGSIATTVVLWKYNRMYYILIKTNGILPSLTFVAGRKSIHEQAVEVRRRPTYTPDRPES